MEYTDPSDIDLYIPPFSTQIQPLTLLLVIVVVDRPPHRDTFSSSSECHVTSPSTVNRT